MMKNSDKKGRVLPVVLWVLFCGAICTFPYTRGGAQEMVSVFPWTVIVFVSISLAMLLYLLFVVISAAFYRPARSLDDASLPGCTVIVPAYNEGKHVAETLASLLDSDFPAEKLEIIAINDGSRDDTWKWILHAVQESGGRIIPVNLPVNGGKKHALVHGIRMAKHDVVVTVDSDSIVNREGVRNIVSAFADPSVGGVAGNIRIKNLADGMLPKMMDVGFMFGFEIVRSAQSITGFVMCTPGALSAYRKSVIQPMLDAWLEQTFLGVPAKIGEDRAIATMILQRGFRVIFQRDAVAFTCVPAVYSGFTRMLLRWTRSDIRENWIMFKACLTVLRPNSFAKVGLFFHLAAQILNTVLPALFVPVLIGMALCLPIGGFASALYAGVVLGLIGALVPAVIYAKRVSVPDSVWALAFSVYSVFALSWICLYSFLTLRNSRWLTRELPVKRAAKRPVAPALAWSGAAFFVRQKSFSGFRQLKKFFPGLY